MDPELKYIILKTLTIAIVACVIILVYLYDQYNKLK